MVGQKQILLLVKISLPVTQGLAAFGLFLIAFLNVECLNKFLLNVHVK